MSAIGPLATNHPTRVRARETMVGGQRIGVAGIVVLLASSAALAETARTEAAGLRFVVPKAWTRTPAPSDVRAAQYRLPRAAGAVEEAELILFFFGRAKGGGVEENLNRWYGQFVQPDGRPSRDAATVSARNVRGLRVTTVDLAGTYSGSRAPSVPAAQPKAGFRMLAAVVEGDGGPWFFKAIGPATTIGSAKTAFETMIDSLEAHR